MIASWHSPSMHADDFPTGSLGEVRRVPQLAYFAYFPGPVPCTIPYTSQTGGLLDEVTGALHRLAA